MSANSRQWLANLAAFAVAAAACVLLRFPPAGSRFYPRCPVFFWLHLYCPGCGGTRALAALLHGRLNEAAHWNAMVVIFFSFCRRLPCVDILACHEGDRITWPTIPDSLLKLSLVLIAIFTVVRNLAPQ